MVLVAWYQKKKFPIRNWVYSMLGLWSECRQKRQFIREKNKRSNICLEKIIFITLKESYSNLSFEFLKHWCLTFFWCCVSKTETLRWAQHAGVPVKIFSWVTCLFSNVLHIIWIVLCFICQATSILCCATVAAKHAYCVARRPICIFNVCWLITAYQSGQPSMQIRSICNEYTLTHTQNWQNI